jgi:hypothetical protein
MTRELREWSSPRLVVLVRGGAQESVLTLCKNTATLGSSGGPNNYDGDCMDFNTCADCSFSSAS